MEERKMEIILLGTSARIKKKVLDPDDRVRVCDSLKDAADLLRSRTVAGVPVLVVDATVTKEELSHLLFCYPNLKVFSSGSAEREIIKLRAEILPITSRYFVLADDLLYIESKSGKLFFHFPDYSEIISLTMKSLPLERMAARGILRCHKSYLINTGYVTRMRYNSVELKGGYMLPVGRCYSGKFIKYRKAFRDNASRSDHPYL